MKKVLIFFLCVSIFLCNLSFAAFSESSIVEQIPPHFGLERNPILPEQYDLFEYLINRGDSNVDGHINAADARLTLRAAAQLVDLDDKQFMLSDVNADGSITANDARTILCISASVNEYLPTIRVEIVSGCDISFGPLYGNDECYWYIEEQLNIVPHEISEERIKISSSDFEQYFTVTPSGLFFGKLICKTTDGIKVLEEYTFEIDLKK